MPDIQALAQIDPKSLGDYLEAMSKGIFNSGMSWRVVESKWPSTREAFMGFDAGAVAALSQLDIDALVEDTRVIRNRRKLEAIVFNAGRMLELEREHGSFRAYLRSHGNYEATVAALKKDFKFLGDTGCYWFLYASGEEVPPLEAWEAMRRR